MSLEELAGVAVHDTVRLRLRHHAEQRDRPYLGRSWYGLQAFGSKPSGVSPLTCRCRNGSVVQFHS